MRSISDFIMEQETGTATSTNDNFVKTYAECVAAIALAQAYAEQATIMEFAAENGIDSLRIIQEAAAEKKQNIFKRAGGAIKNAWKAFVEFLKGILKKIKGLFTTAKVKAATAKLKELDPYDDITVTATILLPGILINIIRKISTDYLGSETMTENDIKDLATFLNDDTAKIEAFATGRDGTISQLLEETNGDKVFTVKDGKITITVGMYQEIMSNAKMGNLDVAIGKLNSRFSTLIDKIDAGTADEDMVDGHSIHYEPLTKALQKFTNTATKAFDMTLKYINNIDEEVNAILKKHNKTLPGEKDKKIAEITGTATTESYYI